MHYIWLKLKCVSMVDCVFLPLSLPIGCVSLSTFVLVVVTPGSSAAAVSTNPVVWFLTILVVEPLVIIPGKQSLATFLVVFCALAGLHWNEISHSKRMWVTGNRWILLCFIVFLWKCVGFRFICGVALTCFQWCACCMYLYVRKAMNLAMTVTGMTVSYTVLCVELSNQWSSSHNPWLFLHEFDPVRARTVLYCAAFVLESVMSLFLVSSVLSHEAVD